MTTREIEEDAAFSRVRKLHGMGAALIVLRIRDTRRLRNAPPDVAWSWALTVYERDYVNHHGCGYDAGNEHGFRQGREPDDGSI